MEEEISEIIIGILREIGQENKNDLLVKSNQNSVILGELDALDSLDFSHLISQLSDEIEKKYNKKFELSDNDIVDNDLNTVAQLAKLVVKKIQA